VVVLCVTVVAVPAVAGAVHAAPNTAVRASAIVTRAEVRILVPSRRRRSNATAG
jgi:hypothetical protein